MSSSTTNDWHLANQHFLMQSLARVRQALVLQAEKQGEWPSGEKKHMFSPQSASSWSMPPTESATTEPSALEQLCQNFGLSVFERDLLLLCAGMELDASFASLCAAVAGKPQCNYPTFSLALAVLEQPDWGALTPDAPLRRWQLIEIGAGNTLTTSLLRIDEQILHYLTGRHHLDQRLSKMGVSLTARDQLVPSHWQLAQQMANTWYLASQKGEELPILQLCGKDVASQRSIAAACCAHLKLQPYNISAELLPTDPTSLNLVKSLWEREYILHNVALLLEGEHLENLEIRQQGVIIQFLESIQAPVMLLSRQRHSQRHRPLMTFDAASPTLDEQRLLWQQGLGNAASDRNEHVDNLVSNFNLSAPAIRAACLKAKSQEDISEAARETQKHEEMETSPLLPLWDICRVQARPRMDELAQRMDSTAEWDDLVLPEREKQVLRDISAQLKQRSKVYESWGFANKSRRGLGISALFSGASGTGKTMAADVLARELRLDLYCIDLSAVVSKYIGETEKNLGRVFDSAETGGVILLFDEADALFGKRSEVKDSHDRYANMEVAYLLQRMEAYPGLSILTTNLKNSVDQAFLRRIRFILQFPFPDVKQRAEIWRRVFPSKTPTEGLDEIKLARLNVTGGNIRNIALNAAFIAAEASQPVRMEHILQAAKSEYIKLERPLTDTEVKGWV